MSKKPLKRTQLPEEKQWWLGLKPGELPEPVILTLLMDIPPDYFRKELDELSQLSGQLAKQLNISNEYLAYKGDFRGHEVGLVYHGSGSFSISTALEELARLGVKTVLRVGNAGGFQEQVQVGDMVVASGAIRAERMLLDYVPLEYPAVADRRLAECLIQASREADATCYEGLTLSVASFYRGAAFRRPRGLGRDRLGRRTLVAEGRRIERGRRNIHRPGDVETLRHTRRCTIGHREPSQVKVTT